jgi:hypothetical protein
MQVKSNTFAPKKSVFVTLIMALFFILPLVGFYVDKGKLIQNPLLIAPLFLPFALLAWGYVNTEYRIENECFSYRSSFLKGSFSIKSIRKVVVNDTLWVGAKPALATKGMIISYNKFDEIYIAPTSNEALLDALIAVNPEIEVVIKS